MFREWRDAWRKSADRRAEARARETRYHEERARTAEREKQAEAERERRVRTLRVLTGEVRYRHAIVDTVRAIGHYVAEPGRPYDPDAATRDAIRRLQEQAVRLGADAVIHARFQVIRYTLEKRQFVHVPAYEVHAFGTAIKILGPPADWPVGEQGGDYPFND